MRLTYPLKLTRQLIKGEKPSIIEQIKKFEKQQGKNYRYRQKAKEKSQIDDEK
ncbi:MAG: hypothetical protein ACTHWZ_02170 [Peptoniphilaceae bacterium]